jgi:hypothetical protein
MLDRAGVTHTVGPDAQGNAHPGELIVYAKDGPRNVGYSGFMTTFSFDDSGNLLNVGSWE